MPKKLPERFMKVVPWEREDFTCESCEKIRAMCRDCNRCSECCTCEYCDLCGLPNGSGLIECTCFQCAQCHQTCPESELNVDDFDYTPHACYDPMKPHEDVCTKCYNIRFKNAQKRK